MAFREGVEKLEKSMAIHFLGKYKTDNQINHDSPEYDRTAAVQTSVEKIQQTINKSAQAPAIKAAAVITTSAAVITARGRIRRSARIGGASAFPEFAGLFVVYIGHTALIRTIPQY